MRGDPSPEALLALLQAIADEQWSISVEQSRLLQRQGQLAETANQLRPLARKIFARERAHKSNGEALERLTA